jgi:hypothetical protein
MPVFSIQFLKVLFLLCVVFLPSYSPTKMLAPLFRNVKCVSEQNCRVVSVP